MTALKYAPVLESAAIARVLLVTHLMENHVALREILAEMNWQLEGTFNCRQGLRMASRQQFSVVICERELPDGDWEALLHEAMLQDCPPKLIVCSEIADETLWARVLNLGGFDVLNTPFVPDDVRQVLHVAYNSWCYERKQKNRAGPVPLRVVRPVRSGAQNNRLHRA